MSYLDLFVSYVRTMMFFSSVPERKLLFCLLSAAKSVSGVQRSPLWNE
jgi:hypothetical protein